jgi:hypothetical protein
MSRGLFSHSLAEKDAEDAKETFIRKFVERNTTDPGEPFSAMSLS